MKVTDVMSVRTYYVMIDSENRSYQYRTDWTGAWEVQCGSSWTNVSDTEELHKALTEYWETKKTLEEPSHGITQHPRDAL